MSEAKLVGERERAIHLLRSGCRVKEVASVLERSVSWVMKWQRRFEAGGWASLVSQSRAPRNNPRQTPAEVERAVRRIRSELEAGQQATDQLHYIGGRAIRARLAAEGFRPPSVPSIERILRRAGMTRVRQAKGEEVSYPHLHPTQPHQHCQLYIGFLGILKMGAVAQPLFSAFGDESLMVRLAEVVMGIIPFHCRLLNHRR